MKLAQYLTRDIQFVYELLCAIWSLLVVKKRAPPPMSFNGRVGLRPFAAIKKCTFPVVVHEPSSLPTPRRPKNRLLLAKLFGNII